MSTYSTIQGSVLLSPEAVARFWATTSWQWFETDTDPGTVAIDSDGWMQLTLAGVPVRNLCRYLLVDLVRAQTAGPVYGKITDDCLDGDNSRTVARFLGTDHLVGAGDCLHQPVPAWRGVQVEIVPAGDGRTGVVALVPGGQYPDWAGPGPVELHGHPPVDDCGCGGYDEALDDWQCANRADDRVDEAE